MKCTVHTDRDAAGVCSSCGRYVCPECKAVINGKIYCNSCVSARLDSGAWPGQADVAIYPSGMGSGSPVPPEIRGWNWGGFLLTWIWGIGNNVWIALIALLGIIPSVGWIVRLTMRIILGIKGNEWAWQSKRWESVEHFKRVQRTWAWFGVGLIVLQIVLMIAVIALVISLYMIGINIDRYPNWRSILPGL